MYRKRRDLINLRFIAIKVTFFNSTFFSNCGRISVARQVSLSLDEHYSNEQPKETINLSLYLIDYKNLLRIKSRSLVKFKLTL